MSSIFAQMYQALLTSQQKPEDYGVYQSQVFPVAGLATLGVALALAIIFYLLLYGPLYSRGLASNNRNGGWLAALLLAAGLGVAVAAGLVHQLYDHQPLVPSAYRTYFVALNALVAGLIFFIFSLVFARFKGHAQGKPF